jgi:hypothetical protein
MLALTGCDESGITYILIKGSEMSKKEGVEMKMCLSADIRFIRKSLQMGKRYILMKIHILAVVLGLLVLCGQAQNPVGNDDDDGITTLTFLVEYEPEEDHDHIEIGLTVESKGRSLSEALRKAKEVAENIEAVAESFCEQNPHEGLNCDETVDVEDFEIEAEYAKRRKELEF